jgi:hypothetical protein
VRRGKGLYTSVRIPVGAAHDRLLRVRGDLVVWSVASQVEDETFAEPFLSGWMGVSFDNEVEEFMQQDRLKRAARAQQIRRLQAHNAAAGAGGDPAGLAGRVAEARHARINAEARLSVVAQSGTALRFSQEAVGKRGNVPSFGLVQSFHLHPFP